MTTPTLVYAPAFQAGLLFGAARRFEAGTQHLSQALADATAAFSGATQAVGASVAELRSLSDSLGTVGTGLTAVVDRLGTIADGVGQLNEKFSRLLDMPNIVLGADREIMTVGVSVTIPSTPVPPRRNNSNDGIASAQPAGPRMFPNPPRVRESKTGDGFWERLFDRVTPAGDINDIADARFQAEANALEGSALRFRTAIETLVTNPATTVDRLERTRASVAGGAEMYRARYSALERGIETGDRRRSTAGDAAEAKYRYEVLQWGIEQINGEIGRRGGATGARASGSPAPSDGTVAGTQSETSFVALRNPARVAVDSLAARANALIQAANRLAVVDPRRSDLQEEMAKLAVEFRALASARGGDSDAIGSVAGSWASSLEARAALPLVQPVPALAPVTGPLPQIRGLPVEPLTPKPPPPPQPGGPMQFVQGGLQQLGQFAKESGEMLKGGLQGAVMSLSPLGMVATLLEGVFAGMAPILEAFSSPLRIVGELLGTLIAPVLRIFFPIIKTVAIAFTYAGQIIANVIGGVAKVVGEVISAVGSIIRRIPGLGGVGRSIQDFGRGIVAASRDAFAVAGQMSEARDRLRDLTFEEAMENVGGAAAEAAESLSNVPNAYRLLGARRWEASDGVAAIRSSAPLPVAVSTNASAATQSNTIYVHNEINAREYTPREMMRAVIDEAKREARAVFGDSTRWSEVM